jgi:sporulation protein YlmC with PRC-barrel domain
MNTYVIRRRKAWASPQVLERVAARSRRIGDEEMSDRIRWIRSYVVHEQDGTLGTVCIYQARDEESIREHADKVGMPADEIVQVADTVIVRPDPVAEVPQA